MGIIGNKIIIENNNIKENNTSKTIMRNKNNIPKMKIISQNNQNKDFGSFDLTTYVNHLHLRRTHPRVTFGYPRLVYGYNKVRSTILKVFEILIQLGKSTTYALLLIFLTIWLDSYFLC